MDESQKDKFEGMLQFNSDTEFHTLLDLLLCF